MLIQVQKTPQLEFPASQFPVDIANAPLGSSRSARERYLVRRFRLTRHVAALLAECAFENGRRA